VLKCVKIRIRGTRVWGGKALPNRILKESICTSDNLNELTPQEEIFFYRLIVNCDDYGIADARIKMLRSRCFPLKTDTIKESDVEKWLRGLIKADLVFLYEVEGKRYLKMTSWENHQQIRAKKSKFPLPDSNGYQLISDDCICPRNPIQSESNPNPIDENMCEKLFEIFWPEYPNKVAKQDAIKAWNKINPSAELFNKIMGGLHKAKASKKWLKDGGEYIPYPATWLNGKRWEDENANCDYDVDEEKIS
jgi:hypothetical protein